MFTAKAHEKVNTNNINNNNNGNNRSNSTITISTISCSASANQANQSQAYSTTSTPACSSIPTMLSAATSLFLDQNGNARDRTHLSLDLRDLKPREPSNSAAGLSPISLPMSLLDSTLLMSSPEKILLAAQQHHHHQQQQLQHGTKLETPTPSNFIFPKNVTTAQESFAEGFQKALQKLQGDTSLPTFQNNSPSTVKFLLSLAALTPTLSPSIPNKNLLGQQIQNDLNLIGAEAARKLELPKIVLNNPTIPTTTHGGLSNQTASDIAKRYMEYFQIGQTSASSTGSNNTAADFQVPQFQSPQIPSSSTMNVNGIGHSQHQKGPTTHQFIKKEPTVMFGNEQNEQQMLGIGSESTAAMIAPQLQLNGGSIQSNNNTNHRQQQQSATIGNNSTRRKDSLSSNGEQMGEQDIRKLERKRARNRLAASKCRQRKLQRISDLEAQVEQEKERSNELEDEIRRLQSTIKRLQEQLINNETGGPLNSRQNY